MQFIPQRIYSAVIQYISCIGIDLCINKNNAAHSFTSLDVMYDNIVPYKPQDCNIFCKLLFYVIVLFGILSAVVNLSIYISHRLSSCKFCDHIAVFSEGTIKEFGTHDELLRKQDGLYAEMFKAQAQYYI